MKRLGLILVLLVGLLLASEGTLAILRHWDVAVTFRADGLIAPADTPTPVATNMPGSAATPQATVSSAVSNDMLLKPGGTLYADIAWNYRIGPRFPKTTIRAEVLDADKTVVAMQQNAFMCDPSSSLQCSGNFTLTLKFGLKDQQGTSTDWLPGSYTLQVSRNYEGLTPVWLATQTFRVGP